MLLRPQPYLIPTYEVVKGNIRYLFGVFLAKREDLMAGVVNTNFIEVYEPNNIEWISLTKTPFFAFKGESCGATSYNECTNCDLYPDSCGKALVYLRAFPHSKRKWVLKIGVGSNLLRPISQSSPFAIIAKDLLRREALYLEKILAEKFKEIVRNPSGRISWDKVIAKNLWDGKKEFQILREFTRKIYDTVPSEIKGLLIEPKLYAPTSEFSSKLPSWVEKRTVTELKRKIKREPTVISGEIIAHRGFVLVIGHDADFWIIELNTPRIFFVNKFTGVRGAFNLHLKIL